MAVKGLKVSILVHLHRLGEEDKPCSISKEEYSIAGGNIGQDRNEVDQ